MPHGKVCYIEIPAVDVGISSKFYSDVFGWNIRARGDGAVAFDDEAAYVSGSFVTGRPPSTVPGITVHIMVTSVEETLAAIVARGGKVAMPFMAHDDHGSGHALFVDPAGNHLGVYQRGEPVGKCLPVLLRRHRAKHEHIYQFAGCYALVAIALRQICVQSRGAGEWQHTLAVSCGHVDIQSVCAQSFKRQFAQQANGLGHVSVPGSRFAQPVADFWNEGTPPNGKYDAARCLHGSVRLFAPRCQQPRISSRSCHFFACILRANSSESTRRLVRISPRSSHGSRWVLSGLIHGFPKLKAIAGPVGTNDNAISNQFFGNIPQYGSNRFRHIMNLQSFG